MRSVKKSRTVSPPPNKADGGLYWQILLWLILAANSFFFLPQCLDRTLAPRFFFLSLILLYGLYLAWKDMRGNVDWRLHSFDLLLLGWYGLNLASTGWAFSWSEAVFYTQKVLLLFLTYWIVRQAINRDERTTRQALRQATVLLTFAVCSIVLVPLALAAMQHGLDNQQLYDLDWFLFGNKSLTAEFLFFLLVFNVLFVPDSTGKNGWNETFKVAFALLLLLIVLLQTRTVYLAIVVGATAYVMIRAFSEPEFARLFRKKILPAAIILFVLFAGFLGIKGTGNSLAERLNPLTYLDSGTANERRFVWYKTDLLNADHFWLGVGNGSWKFWFPSKNIEGSYRMQEQNIVFTRAHNDYLEVRSEMGIVGVTLFCVLFGVAFLAVFLTLRKRDTGFRERQDLLVLTVCVLGYCIIQYLDFPRERIEMQVVLAILFAYIAFHTRALWAKLPGISTGKFKFVFIGLATAGLLFNLLIGWNRIKGEIHNVRMMKAQVKHDYPGMITEVRSAENRFYKYNDVAVPLAWFEGIAFYQMGQNDKAVSALERAYYLNPWSFQVLNNYASALVKAKRYQEAIPFYEKVVEINPRYEDGKFNLAYTWYEIGDIPKSLEWLDRMDTIPNPKTPDEFRKNASIHKRRSDFRKVIESR